MHEPPEYQIGLIDPNSFSALVDNKEILVVDMRERHEWHATGMPVNSVGIPLSTEKFADVVLNTVRGDKSHPLALICHAGVRSKTAAFLLAEAGFQNVASMEGGIVAWLGLGLPVTTQIPDEGCDS